MKETDDYQLDVEFGTWLAQIRTQAKLTLRDAARQSGLSEARLQSLELGYAEKGILRKEVEALSKTYSIPLEDFLSRAMS